MEYPVHEAQTQLSRLIAAACRGEEVIIVRGEERIAQIIPLLVVHRDRVPGKLAGKISWKRDAFSPLSDSELSDLGFE